MTQELLHGAGVVAGLQQVRRERMARRARRRGLVHARIADGLTHRALKGLVGQVMAALFATARMARAVQGGEDVLPSPLARRVRILAVQRERQRYGAASIRVMRIAVL